MSGQETSNQAGSAIGGLQRTGARERVRFDTIVHTVGDAIYQLDLDGNFVAVNDVVVKSTGYSREELIGSPGSILVDDEDLAKLEATIKDLLTNDEKANAVVEIGIQTAFGETIPAEARMALLRNDGEAFGTVGIVRDISGRKQREHRLAAQRDALERLDRINTVIRDINRTLVNADTRGEIEHSVCVKLAESAPFAFAWIGEGDPTSGVMEPRAQSGGAEESTDLVGTQVTDPDATALHTGEVAVVQNLSAAPSEPWRDAAIALGFESRATIPIVYEGSIYAVLNVYATCPEAFDERETEVLGELGESIGLAINALERKDALMSDQMLELGFRSDGLAKPFVESVGNWSGEIRVDRVIPLDGDWTLGYYTVQGMAQEEFLDAVESFEMVSDARVIGARDDGFRAEVRLHGETLVSVFATHGGRVKHISIENGTCGIVAEVPFGIDVRRVVEAVQEVYPSVELVSKKTVEREDRSPLGVHRDVEERLSDRQFEALEAAHCAGFFHWPRDSTGEELAESLGVSAPTFHEHLRAAQRKLVGTVFEESTIPE